MSIRSSTRSTCALPQSVHAKAGSVQLPCATQLVSGRLLPSDSSARARMWRVSQRPQSTAPRPEPPACLEPRSMRALCTRGSSDGSRNASIEDELGRASSLTAYCHFSHASSASSASVAPPAVFLARWSTAIR